MELLIERALRPGLHNAPNCSISTSPIVPPQVMWVPDRQGTHPDLLATTGDHLRVWRVNEDSVVLDHLLTNVSGTPAYFSGWTQHGDVGAAMHAL